MKTWWKRLNSKTIHIFCLQLHLPFSIKKNFHPSFVQKEKCVSRVPYQNGLSQAYIYSRDTPFWSETLVLLSINKTNPLRRSISVRSGYGFPVRHLMSRPITCHATNRLLYIRATQWTPPSKFPSVHCFVGLVVKASDLRAEDPGFISRLLRGDFSRSSHTSEFKIGSPVATLPGAWRYRVSAGTGWLGVSILWLGEV